MLQAFDAVSLAELRNGTMNPAGNSGMPAKFSVPAVADGKVYLATFFYGLRR
jgi:hypothetical protein